MQDGNNNNGVGLTWRQSGAFSFEKTGELRATYTSTNNKAIANDKITFKASSSNAIYGASTTVQPPAIVVIPQIKF